MKNLEDLKPSTRLWIAIFSSLYLMAHFYPNTIIFETIKLLDIVYSIIWAIIFLPFSIAYISEPKENEEDIINFCTYHPLGWLILGIAYLIKKFNNWFDNLYNK